MVTREHHELVWERLRQTALERDLLKLRLNDCLRQSHMEAIRASVKRIEEFIEANPLVELVPVCQAWAVLLTVHEALLTVLRNEEVAPS